MTDKQHTATDRQSSRRGFLKQAATASILGMTELTVTTQDASAATPIESQDATAASIESQDATAATPIESTERHPSADLGPSEELSTNAVYYINIYGRPYGEYQVITSGHIEKGPLADPEDTVLNNSLANNARGHVNFYGRDNYMYSGYLEQVIELSGNVSYEIGRM